MNPPSDIPGASESGSRLSKPLTSLSRRWKNVAVKPATRMEERSESIAKKCRGVQDQASRFEEKVRQATRPDLAEHPQVKEWAAEELTKREAAEKAYELKFIRPAIEQARKLNAGLTAAENSLREWEGSTRKAVQSTTARTVGTSGKLRTLSERTDHYLAEWTDLLAAGRRVAVEVKQRLADVERLTAE